MKRIFCLCCAIIVALSCEVNAAPNKTLKYVFTDLGEGNAVAINDQGQVIVEGDRTSSVWTPYKPNSVTGKFWDLGFYRPDDSDGESWLETIAYDINNKGEVVGLSGEEPNSKYFSYEYAFKIRVGQKIDKKTLLNSARGLIPRAINNQGVVVGQFLATSTSHASKWSAASGEKSLGKMHPGDSHCAAIDINDHGTIVGIGDYVGVENYSSWVITGKHKVDLGIGAAKAINNHDAVVGAFKRKACIWNKSKMSLLDETIYRTDIPASGDDTGSSYYSIAMDINDVGDIVGMISAYCPATYSLSERYVGHAALWISGKVVDLNDVAKIPDGWTLGWANAINEKGQIVGYGSQNGNPWDKRAFLLTPVSR